MMRLIVRVTDTGAACNVGGPVTTKHQTIVIDCPALERIFRHCQGEKWLDAEVIGAELIGDPIVGSNAEVSGEPIDVDAGQRMATRRAAHGLEPGKKTHMEKLADQF